MSSVAEKFSFLGDIWVARSRTAVLVNKSQAIIIGITCCPRGGAKGAYMHLIKVCRARFLLPLMALGVLVHVILVRARPILGFFFLRDVREP